MEVKQAQTAELFTVKNTVRSMYDKADEKIGNAGKVAIIKPSHVKEFFTSEYQTPEQQLFRLECGFGVFPDKMGNACYGYFCADGEKCRMEKYDFCGIADEATTRYAEELESKWKKKAAKAV